MKITLLYNSVLISVGLDVLNRVKVWVIMTYMLALSVLPLQKFNFFSRLHIFEGVFVLGLDGISLGNQFIAFQKALFSFERLEPITQ